MSIISNSLIQGAANGKKSDFLALHYAIFNELKSIHAAQGTNFLKSTNTTPNPITQPPGLATFTVAGANGSYTLQIQNAAQTNNATVYHQVSYSAQSDFSSGVTTLPIATTPQMIVALPGTTLYWRLRSSFDQNNWNAYAFSGQVSAGLQSSAASENNTPLNQTNYANVDSIAAGGAAVVRVYGGGGPYTNYVSVKGNTEAVLPSATIVGVPYNSDQIVAYDGEQYQVKETLPEIFNDSWTPTGQASVVGSGTPSLPTVTPILLSGQIIGYNFTPGNGLTSVPIFTITDSTGTGAVAIGTVQNGKLYSLVAGAVGTGYSSSPTVTVSGGFVAAVGGGGAQGSNGGRLTKI
jgi:hypothetical protein